MGPAKKKEERKMKTLAAKRAEIVRRANNLLTTRSALQFARDAKAAKTVGDLDELDEQLDMAQDEAEEAELDA